MIVSNIPQYLPPAEGDPDSADPHFKSRERQCGYCGAEFKTSAGYRYYCGRCRVRSFRQSPNGKDRKKTSKVGWLISPDGGD